MSLVLFDALPLLKGLKKTLILIGLKKPISFSKDKDKLIEKKMNSSINTKLFHVGIEIKTGDCITMTFKVSFKTWILLK